MPEPLARRVQHWLNVDRKGLGLILIGCVWIAMSFSVPTQPNYDSLLHEVIPDPIRMAIWCASGVGALVASKVHSIRPWVMGFLTVEPVIRFFGFGYAWVVFLIPGGRPGYDRGWLASLLSLLMVGFVFYVAADSSEYDNLDKLNSVLTEEE